MTFSRLHRGRRRDHRRHQLRRRRTAGYRDAGLDPQTVARTKAIAAAAVGGDPLLHTHVADYQALYDARRSTSAPRRAAQRAMDTACRLDGARRTGRRPTRNWRPATCSSAAT